MGLFYITIKRIQWYSIFLFRDSLSPEIRKFLLDGVVGSAKFKTINKIAAYLIHEKRHFRISLVNLNLKF